MSSSNSKLNVRPKSRGTADPERASAHDRRADHNHLTRTNRTINKCNEPPNANLVAQCSDNLAKQLHPRAKLCFTLPHMGGMYGNPGIRSGTVRGRYARKKIVERQDRTP